VETLKTASSVSAGSPGATGRYRRACWRIGTTSGSKLVISLPEAPSQTRRALSWPPAITNIPSGVAAAITYHHVGVIVRLSAQKAPQASNRKDPDVRMAIQLAALTPSDTELALGEKATAIRNISVEHSEPLVFGRAVIMLFPPHAAGSIAGE
jgi:hypothetical protein